MIFLYFETGMKNANGKVNKAKCLEMINI